MQPIFVRGDLRGLLAASAVLVATLGLAHSATACPNDIPIQRALSGPYSAVWDQCITNAPGDENHHDPSGGKNALLALGITGKIAVAYERPDPNNAPGNALSLQRFNINFNLPGECVCDLDPLYPEGINDECPLRLDDKPTNGTLFSHVSLAIAREGGSQAHAGEVFATWLSQPPGQTPSRVILPFGYLLRETPFPDTIPFSHSYFGPAPASSGGNDDFGPSATV